MSTTKTQIQDPTPPDYQAASTSQQPPTDSLPIYTEQEPPNSNSFLHLRNALSNSHRDLTHDVEIWRQYITSRNPSPPPPAPKTKSDKSKDYPRANTKAERETEEFVILQEFLTAIDNGQTDVIQFLISQGLVTANSVRGDTMYAEPPLMRAVWRGKADVVRTLIELGAERDAFGSVVCPIPSHPT